MPVLVVSSSKKMFSATTTTRKYRFNTNGRALRSSGRVHTPNLFLPNDEIKDTHFSSVVTLYLDPALPHDGDNNNGKIEEGWG